MTLQTIVDVTITRATAKLTRVGFGTPLLLVTHSVAGVPDAAIYSDPADMLTDGFLATDKAYLMALALVGQGLNVEQFVIGKRSNQPLRTVNLIPSATPAASTLHRLEVNGTNFDFTTDGTPTVAEITAGLVAALDQDTWITITAYVVGDHVTLGGNVYICTTAGTSGATGPTGTGSGITDGTVIWAFQGVEQNVVGADNTTDMDVQSADTPGGTPTAGPPFSLTVDRSQYATIKDTTADAGIATDLQAVRDLNDDWYGITGDWHDEATATALATVIETLTKLHVWSSQDTDVLDPADLTDAFSVMNGTALERSGGIWHSNPSSGWPAAAWIGSLFPLDPGEATWKFKTLTGVLFDSFNGSEAAALLAKKANNYVRVAGNNITQEGVVHQGEFLDTVRSLDFVAQRIAEDVFGHLAAQPKNPYTDLGVSSVQSIVDGRMQSATEVGSGSGQIFTPDPAPVTTAPLVSSIDPATRASRLLPDIKSSATLAGAVHNVEVNVTVSA